MNIFDNFLKVNKPFENQWKSNQKYLNTYNTNLLPVDPCYKNSTEAILFKSFGNFAMYWQLNYETASFSFPTSMAKLSYYSILPTILFVFLWVIAI